ncbi:MAG: aminoglycoside phosphotransferase family protein [Lachnospiraceae bacterium]|nr:aminoglycoside phosphotransferase family protein [Lachnospiraceae bacterium]
MSKITETILRRYGIAGSVVSEEELSGGNVNLTYRVTVRDGASLYSYLVQKINADAMKDPRGSMKNIVLVTEHLRRKGIRMARLYPVGRSGERLLTLQRNGATEYWRVEEYVEAVELSPEDPNVLYEMARAFGRVNAALADLDPRLLKETVRGFHNTYARFRALWKAAAEDRAGRTESVRRELMQLKALEAEACEVSLRYAAGEYPIRVTHNDTKFNNVLFTSKTPPYGAVVIDFDTVLTGMVAYDFADSVRSVAKVTGGSAESPTATIDAGKYRVLAEGYLAETREMLTDAELKAMTPCVTAVTAELAARYLTDYLEGDRYFKTAYAEQNRDKARLNIALAQDASRRMPELEQILLDALRVG